MRGARKSLLDAWHAHEEFRFFFGDGVFGDLDVCVLNLVVECFEDLQAGLGYLMVWGWELDVS